MAQGLITWLPNHLKDYFFDSVEQAEYYINDKDSPEKLARFNRLKDSISEGQLRYIIVPRDDELYNYFIHVCEIYPEDEDEDIIRFGEQIPMVLEDDKLRFLTRENKEQYKDISELVGIVNEDNITGGKRRTNRKRKTNRKHKTNRKRRTNRKRHSRKN